MYRILFYGDSNTYGFDPHGYFGGRYPESVRWVSVLQRSLLREWEIYDDGMNGREIPANQSGWDNMKASIDAVSPIDIFAIMLGSNDYLNMYEPDIMKLIERMETTITIVMNHLRERKARTKILLMAPPYIETMNDDYYAKYDTTNGKLSFAYRKLAEHMKILFADTASWRVKLAADGVHMSEEGNLAFAARMEELLLYYGMELMNERGGSVSADGWEV